MITMYDSAENNQFPANPQAVAGYVDGGIGDQPNYQWLVGHFPHAHHLSIALYPSHDADCLDVERGAASPDSAAAWYAGQVARGITRPCLYASADAMESDILPIIKAAGFPREKVRLWSAHYGQGEHICGPRSCGLMSIDADGTQWTSNAMGRNLDQSILNDNFFGTPPAPTWMEKMMQTLPTIKEGSTDSSRVRTVQGLLNARGHSVAIDGIFGRQTDAAVRAAQHAGGVAVDGTVGPVTWVVLITGP